MRKFNIISFLSFAVFPIAFILLGSLYALFFLPAEATKAEPTTVATFVEHSTEPSIEPSTEPSTEPSENIALTPYEAFEIFRENPYAEVEGYILNDYGWLLDSDENFILDVHTLDDDLEQDDSQGQVWKSTREAKYVYDKKNNIVTCYSFGNISETHLHEEYTFWGISSKLGYIVQDGNNLYAIDTELNKTYKIATEVKGVISCEDATVSDQPTLLMQDGSIQYYNVYESTLYPYVS